MNGVPYAGQRDPVPHSDDPESGNRPGVPFLGESGDGASGEVSPPPPSTAPPAQQLVQDVLEKVAESTAKRTPFRRVLATCYAQPITPGKALPVSGVLGLASRGLSEEDRTSLASLLSEEPDISGLRYHEAYRVSNSYVFRKAEDAARLGHRIPSHRAYAASNGWRSHHVLLVPFWIGGQIIGQISVDDPRDGRNPDDSILVGLEQIAGVASLALRYARVLEGMSAAHRVFRDLAEGGMTGSMIVSDGRIHYSNDKTEQLLGYDAAALADLSPWWSFVHPDDRPFAWDCKKNGKPQTIRAVRRDGRVVWCTACARAMRNGKDDAVAIEMLDITERVETELQLRDKALHDPLTGLRNRAYFDEAIQLEIVRCKRYKRPFTLMIADLRCFKHINDTLGHLEGDRVLAGIAGVLQNELRESDWMVRYGGDEFLLVLPETGREIQALVQRLQARAADWAQANVPRGLPFGVDFGWSTWSPDAPATVEGLLKAADDMLYRNKRDSHSQSTT